MAIFFGVPWSRPRRVRSWSARPRLLVGTALLQVTSYAVPCVKNRGWFSDGEFSRMAQEVRPGQSRLYASVVVEGVVAQGDSVVLEPLLVPAQPPAPEQLQLAT